MSTLFDSDDVLSQLRAVQAIVTHLETFPKERACAACLRAEHFGGFGDALLASAAMDRLLHGAHVLVLDKEAAR